MVYNVVGFHGLRLLLKCGHASGHVFPEQADRMRPDHRLARRGLCVIGVK